VWQGLGSYEKFGKNPAQTKNHVPTQKKQKHKLNGWLNLDKPVGLSSTQAMAKVRWLMNAEKAGHGGTLDPFATGVLPIAFGDATKLLHYVLDGKKRYQLTVQWGEQRNTDDLTGEVIQTSPHRPSREQIESILPEFTGSISQIPPNFSALHIDGERAYDLARAGKEVKLEPRQVTISQFKILDMPNPDTAIFEVACSKGTYIRSLARDMGIKLGCFGHVNALKRLSSGPFKHETAISLEKLLEIGQKTDSLNELQATILPLTAVLDDIPALAVSEFEARKLRQGQRVRLHPMRITPHLQSANPLAAKDHTGLVALVELAEDELRPLRVFKPQSTFI
jgi:tRNA pseudouridine55 synthase